MATPQKSSTPPVPAAKPGTTTPPAATTKPVKPPRDKAAAFKRLAIKRVGKLLKSLEAVKELSNKRSYSYDADQVQKIEKAVNDKVKETLAAFTDAGTSEGGFTL